MGQIFSSLWTALFASKELKIVMVGACQKLKGTILPADTRSLTELRCCNQQVLQLICAADGA